MTEKIGLYRDKRNKNRPWVVRWFGETDETGKQKRYTKAFKLKVDAEQFAAEKTAAFGKGGRRDKPRNISLAQFLQNWLKSRNLRPETIKLYRNTTDRLAAYFGPDASLPKITPYLAERFIAEIQPLRGEALSEWTRHRALRHCKTIFESAVTWEHIAQNPFTKIKAPKCLPSDWYYLKPDEYLSLLAVAPSIRWKARYALAYTAGLRFGELFNLTWHDIDFENGEVHIRNRKGTAATPEFYIKDYEQRIVKLPRVTIDILEDLRTYNELTDQTPYVSLDRRQYETATAKWQKYREQRRAWRNQDMVNNVGRELARHVSKAGIKPTASLSIHTLRKCAGKNWAMVNRDPSVTQKLMGHSSIATTMKYYDQVTDEDRARAAAAIDSLMAEAKQN